MIVNEVQQSAVESEDHVCLVSCPGSGKTRTVVAKVLWCLERVRGTSRRIGCITYTNTAVNEIEGRLRQFGVNNDDLYYEISTIHAFCLNHILRPYHYRLPEFADGFDVVTPDDDRWHSLVDHLIEKHCLGPRSSEAFERIRREPGGTVIPPDEIGQAASQDFVDYFDGNGLVSFEDMVYHSARLVGMFPFIARGLASRFVWLLVDEFQDTSASQVEIFKAIADHRRTKYLLVGDPNQSIMSFAGGRRGLMREFAGYLELGSSHVLRGNYRCSSRIVSRAERLCASKPPMQAVGANADFPAEPEYVHTASVTQGLFEHFLPAVDTLGIRLGDAAVLAPSWFTFPPVTKELRQRNVPVIGPGARPYRRSREFAQFAEHACACLEQQSASLNRAVHRALFLMLLNINGRPDWRLYSYDGRRALFELLILAREIRQTHEAAVAWLREAAAAFTGVLLREDLLPFSKASVLIDSSEAMIADMVGKNVDIDNLTTSELGLYARPDQCLQLMTLHSSKGREFDAVAIVDLHDGKIPHYKVTSTEGIEEARRLLYVGTTRARKLLMYFTDSANYRNRPTRFLGDDGLGFID